ncbi:hypothetical protein GCM10010123_12340 [Pilimelia anulata]|uniref:Uncharacterized protein n=1 Tax=Pilimelia anulata TaxID=53371 RepID=A0A8J3B7Z0_9ACTN|nr:hypothetical protein [Pilimelia anulata]GGJ84209.1 hypothetical protein GCM10010123_12340 [Pilimelia anulata]
MPERTWTGGADPYPVLVQARVCAGSDGIPYEYAVMIVSGHRRLSYRTAP